MGMTWESETSLSVETVVSQIKVRSVFLINVKDNLPQRDVFYSPDF